MLRLPLTEFPPGFRIYARALVETLPLEANASDHLFSFEVLAQAAHHGVDVREVPVEADYLSDHTSISLWQAAVYSFDNVVCLGKYVLAQAGLRHSAQFPQRPAPVAAGAAIHRARGRLRGAQRRMMTGPSAGAAPTCRGCDAPGLSPVVSLGGAPVNAFVQPRREPRSRPARGRVDVDFVVDDTPLKQGKLHARLPRPRSRLDENRQRDEGGWVHALVELPAGGPREKLSRRATSEARVLVPLPALEEVVLPADAGA